MLIGKLQFNVVGYDLPSKFKGRPDALKWKPNRHGFEGNAWQAALQHLMKEEMFRFKYYFEPIKAVAEREQLSAVPGDLKPLAEAILGMQKELAEVKALASKKNFVIAAAIRFAG